MPDHQPGRMASLAKAHFGLNVTLLHGNDLVCNLASRFGHSCFVLELVAHHRSNTQQLLHAVSLCRLTAKTRFIL